MIKKPSISASKRPYNNQLYASHATYVVNVFVVAILALALFSPWSKQVGLANFSIYKSLLAAMASSLLLCVTCWFVMQQRTSQMLVAVVISWIKSSFLLLFMLGGLSVFFGALMCHTPSVDGHIGLLPWQPL